MGRGALLVDLLLAAWCDLAAAGALGGFAERVAAARTLASRGRQAGHLAGAAGDAGLTAGEFT